MLHVHHHPVIQKVIIGMFVFGLMMFSVRVAFGAMTFPLPVKPQPPISLAEVKFPTELPSFAPSDCNEGCKTVSEMCVKLAGNDVGAVNICATDAAQCTTKCIALVQELQSQVDSSGTVIAPDMPTTDAQPENDSVAPTASDDQEVPDQHEMMQREEEQKTINAQALEQLKEIGDKIAPVLSHLSARLDAATAAGLSVNADVSSGLVQAHDMLSALNNATDTQSAQDALQHLQEQIQSLSGDAPAIDLATNVSSVLTQVEKEYARLKKSVDAQHPKFLKLDTALQNAIGNPADGVVAIRAELDSIKVLAPTEAIAMLQGDIFTRFQDVWQQYGVIEALCNQKSTLTKISVQIKINDRLIAKLSKIQALLKIEAANIKPLIAGKDSKKIFDGFSKIADLQQQFEAVLGQSQDDGDMTNDKLDATNHWGVPTFGPPSGLPGSGVTDEKSLNMMRILAPYLPKSAN